MKVPRSALMGRGRTPFVTWVKAISSIMPTPKKGMLSALSSSIALIGAGFLFGHCADECPSMSHVQHRLFVRSMAGKGHIFSGCSLLQLGHFLEVRATACGAGGG